MDLYSVNVPVVEGVEGRKVMVTNALQNYWTSGSSFEEIDAVDDGESEDPQVREKEIREGGECTSSDANGATHKHRHFKWAPKFGDIQKAVEASPPGNDGWAINQGCTRLVACCR